MQSDVKGVQLLACFGGQADQPLCTYLQGLGDCLEHTDTRVSSVMVDLRHILPRKPWALLQSFLLQALLH